MSLVGQTSVSATKEWCRFGYSGSARAEKFEARAVHMGFLRQPIAAAFVELHYLWE
jgi:hypothetical protein